MEILFVLFGIVLFYLIGIYLLSYQKKSEFTPLETTGLSFGLGAGVVSLQMLIYVVVGIPVSSFSICISWLAFILLTQFKKKLRFEIPKRNVKLSFFEKLLILFTCLNLLFLLVESISRPVNSWDAVANWSLISKAFFIDGTINGEFYHFANIENPILISFQESFFYFLSGKVIDRFVLLLFPFYFINLLLLFYSLVKRYSSQTNALFFTFLLASLPNMLRQGGYADAGYVDLPLGYYFFSSIFLFSFVIKKTQKSFILLLSLFLGFGSLVKDEGAVFLFICLIVLTLYLVKQKKYECVVYCLPGVVIITLWRFFGVYQDFPTHYFQSGSIRFERTYIIFSSIFQEMYFNIVRWNFLWIVFFPVLFLIKRNTFTLIVSTIIFLQLLSYVGIYFYTPAEIPEQIVGTLDRFLLQVCPIAFFLIAYSCKDLLNFEKSEKPD